MNRDNISVSLIVNENTPLILTTIINQKTAKNSPQGQSFTDKISHNATPSALYTKH